jgi:hypothetical protein
VLFPLALFAVAPAQSQAAAHHYDLEEGVRLGPQMEAALGRVADEFHRRTGRGIVVTSGTRSAREQAAAMFIKLRLGQRLTSIYRDQRAASEVQTAYRQHYRNRDEAVGAMARVIDDQVRRGCYISRHLRASAADVRSRDMSRRERRIFHEIIDRDPALTLLIEGTPPHFHLELR